MRAIAKFVIVWFATFSISTCFAQMYTINYLDQKDGTLNQSGSFAAGINGYGQVIGSAWFYDGASHYIAFRTAPSSPIDFATDNLVPNGPCSVETGPYIICRATASGINDSGQVAGWMTWRSNGPGDPQPFRTQPNEPIRSPEDAIVNHYGQRFGYDVWTSGINNSGQVVGTWLTNYKGAWRTAADGSLVAYPIGKLATAEDLQNVLSYANAINDSGQVVGSSPVTRVSSFSWITHAYRTAPNSIINPTTDDLGSLGGSYSTAYSINVFGQVVGSSTTGGDTSIHAFRTGPNHPIDPSTDDLGPGVATSINNFGQVVGSAGNAFIFDGGVMRDLIELVQGGSMCPIVGVVSNSVGPSSPNINDAGQIAANIDCNGELHAVRLDPIFTATVQRPIRADGCSVFSYKRGVVPVKFNLNKYGVQSCSLPPAIISITRATSDSIDAIDESTYSTSADIGSSFRIDSNCGYVYNLSTSALGVGTYRVDISINGIMVGHAVFGIN